MTFVEDKQNHTSPYIVFLIRSRPMWQTFKNKIELAAANCLPTYGINANK